MDIIIFPVVRVELDTHVAMPIFFPNARELDAHTGPDMFSLDSQFHGTGHRRLKIAPVHAPET